MRKNNFYNTAESIFNCWKTWVVVFPQTQSFLLCDRPKKNPSINQKTIRKWHNYVSVLDIETYRRESRIKQFLFVI